jgi:hypothetical protein
MSLPGELASVGASDWISGFSAWRPVLAELAREYRKDMLASFARLKMLLFLFSQFTLVVWHLRLR